MTKLEIAGLLGKFKQMKKEDRDIHSAMLKIAVEELGINIKVAQQTNLETFLDGYLLGQEMTESCRKMTNYQISALLHDSRQTKEKARNLRQQMLRVAVEKLRMEQNEALRANLEVFLDGYLLGQGMMQPWRKSDA